LGIEVERGDVVAAQHGEQQPGCEHEQPGGYAEGEVEAS
jgi:hypothetical protein